jgi:phage host-nuclease inhibitor protein Gam
MSALPEDLLPPDLALDEPPLTDEEVERFISARVEYENAPADALLPPAPRWRIEDDGAAEWAMRKLARERQAFEDAHDQALAWCARIDKWWESTSAPLVRRIRWWEGHLEDYARRQREAGRKTVSLPSGKVSTRPVPASVKVADEAQVLAGLPAEVRKLVVKESVRLRELQAATAVARTATVHLACGHSFEAVVLDPKELGPSVVCPSCGEQEGRGPEEHAVVGVDLSAPIPVLKSNRKPIPGAIVEPERVSVTVKPS